MGRTIFFADSVGGECDEHVELKNDVYPSGRLRDVLCGKCLLS